MEDIVKGNISIEDITAMNALYRPGPMEYIPDYIEGRRNPDSIKYDCPELEPILKSTYGQIVYQEQVMAIVRDLAGYSWGRSDLVRRAMSKKHQDEIDAEREKFVYGDEELGVPGCINRGISEDVANKIFDKMVDFAKYAFNKSHAELYSITSFKTAYCKYYYPAEYLCSVMNYAEKIDELKDDIQDARDFNIEVIPPDINYSQSNFSVVNNKILFGLSRIKGVGSAANEIIRVREEQPFSGIKDFMLRCRINVKALSALIDAGAFDSLGINRASLQLDNGWMQDLLNCISKINEKETFIKNAKAVKTFCENFSDVEKLKDYIREQGLSYSITSKKVPTMDSVQKKIYSAQDKIKENLQTFINIEIMEIEEDKQILFKKEKKVLGLYFTGSPLDDYLIETDYLSNIEEGEVDVSGIITNFVEKKSKKGNLFAIFELEDKTGSVSCSVYSFDYIKLKGILKEGECVRIKGNAELDEFKSNEDEVYYKIVAKTASKLKMIDKAYRFVTDDIQSWVDNDYQMLKSFESENGYKLYILNRLTGLQREANFKVSPDVLNAGAELYKVS